MRVSSLVRRFACLLAVAASATAAAAQSGTIRGVVTDSTTGPVIGAVVTVDASALLTQTNGRGAYEFRGVPAGSHTVRVRALGHTPSTQSVNVEATGSVTANFTIGSNAVELARVEVVAGSRAQHKAADELAVPVDVFTTEQIQQQGSTETGRILAALSPSVNMPHQSVTDANDIVQPFTLRGLSPDHTLVLINGWRQHQTALVNTFPYGSGAGSSGVDLNSIPAGAIDRIEVLRDGDAADYGSDAIAGVVNIKMKEGQFSPFLNVEGGRYTRPTIRTTALASTSTAASGSSSAAARSRSSASSSTTIRRTAPGRTSSSRMRTGSPTRSTRSLARSSTRTTRSNSRTITGATARFGMFRRSRTSACRSTQSGNTELYAFGGFSNHFGTGNGFWRYLDGNRNWQQIYPQGFLPEFDPTSKDYSGTAGIRTAVGGWSLDFGGSYGLNTFDYNLRNTLNPSLGPCLDVACAPGPDGELGTADDPGIPNQTTFYAGRLRRSEYELGINGSKAYAVGLPAPLNVAAGVLFRGEDYRDRAGRAGVVHQRWRAGAGWKRSRAGRIIGVRRLQSAGCE